MHPFKCVILVICYTLAQIIALQLFLCAIGWRCNSTFLFCCISSQLCKYVLAVGISDGLHKFITHMCHLHLVWTWSELWNSLHGSANVQLGFIPAFTSLSFRSDCENCAPKVPAWTKSINKCMQFLVQILCNSYNVIFLITLVQELDSMWRQ